MKDEHDKVTVDFIENAQPRKPHRKPFDYFGKLTVDAQSREAELPDCAQLRSAPELPAPGNFVPVSFVASDWKVTARRIRALLSAGRLAGRVQENGYWEVRYPYCYSENKRGPKMKRLQQLQQPKKPKLKLVRKPA